MNEMQTKSLQSYRRLWISVRDLEESRNSIDEILTRNLKHPGLKEVPPLIGALTSSLVISYARPFVHSRGNHIFADRTLSGFLLRSYSRSERQFHDYIIEFRNKVIAHSDSDVLELQLQLYPDGDGGIHRRLNDPLYRNELKMLKRMINKVILEIESQCSVLRQGLPHNVWL